MFSLQMLPVTDAFEAGRASNCRKSVIRSLMISELKRFLQSRGRRTSAIFETPMAA
jgi:hypothetical protein